MSNLTQVTLVNGKPIESGTVSTLDALMADGGQATLGAKADAKSAASDATPVSAMSVWKQISASVQAVAASIAGTLTVALAAGSAIIGKVSAVDSGGTDATDTTNHAIRVNVVAGGAGGGAATIADGADVTLGSKADAKSTATDTTPITAMSVWKQISASVQAIATSVAGTLTVGLPSGASTSANQTTANTSLSTLAGAVSSAKMATKAASGDFADGAIATVGAKTDAKSTATDATSVSAMSVWKQISASVQAIATSVAATLTVAGTVAVSTINGVAMAFGSGANGATVQRVTVATDDSLLSATNTKLDTLHSDALPTGQGSASAAGRVVPAFQGSGIVATITRPANVTAYSANDVVGGAITFTNFAPAACEMLVTRVQLEADITAIPSGMTTFRLYLYNVTPPSAIADNGAWSLASGDRASYIGVIPLGTLNLPGGGGTCILEVTGALAQITTAGANVFGYLVTDGGYTPAANSEVYKPTIHGVPI